MKKEQVIETVKDKKYILGVISTISIVIVGAIVVNAFSPTHHYGMMGQRRFDGNHMNQDLRNNQFNDIDINDITNDYTEVELDSGLDIGASAALKDNALTIADMLTYSIQDEYLAHAEYEYIIEEFGSQRPFSNIINSELNHIALLTPLLEKYATLPIDNAKDIIAKPSSLTESYEAGVKAEVANIKMYETFLSKELPDDVKVVFTELLNASQNHLQAFARKASRY